MTRRLSKSTLGLALAASAMSGGNATAGDAAAPLSPGYPAGVASAQLKGGTRNALYAVGLGAAIGGIVLMLSDGHDAAIQVTVTPPTNPATKPVSTVSSTVSSTSSTGAKAGGSGGSSGGNATPGGVTQPITGGLTQTIGGGISIHASASSHYSSCTGSCGPAPIVTNDAGGFQFSTTTTSSTTSSH